MERNSTLRDKQDRSLSLSLSLSSFPSVNERTNERTNHAENEVIYEVEMGRTTTLLIGRRYTLLIIPQLYCNNRREVDNVIFSVAQNKLQVVKIRIYYFIISFLLI